MEVVGASIAVEVFGVDPVVPKYIVTIQRDTDPGIPFSGWWEVPGGTREEDETPQQCAIRELREEVGVQIAEDEIVWGALYPSQRSPGAYNAYFVARLPGPPDLRLGDEGGGCRLMEVGYFETSGEVIDDHVSRYRDYRQDFEGRAA